MTTAITYPSPVVNPLAVNLLTTAPQSASALSFRRATNIQNFLYGAVQAAPAWAATTTYVLGNCVSLPSGQVISCCVAGTSGGSAPVLSKTALAARPIVDGTVTWYGVYQNNAQTNAIEVAPTITAFASAAAAGLTETLLRSGSVPDSRITAFGGVLTALGFQNALACFVYSNGTPPGTGNSTALATGSGYTANQTYNAFHYDLEFYITDSLVGLTFVATTAVIGIEIDGKLMQANAAIGTGVSAQCLVFDYNGVVKRRKVTVNCCTPTGSASLRGVALSTTGFLEATDSPNDQMIIFGDSILNTISNPVPQQPIAYPGALLKRYLGLSGVINTTAAGQGYIAQSANNFNVPNLLGNSVNQTLFGIYNPGHVLITPGYNDIGNAVSLVNAAALQTWQYARAIFPDAKITITDGFTQAKGPDAATLAQANGLRATYATWGDLNSRFISMCASAATAWVRGTGTASGAIAAGNSCWVVGTDNVHDTPLGADGVTRRLTYEINNAWNGQY